MEIIDFFESWFNSSHGELDEVVTQFRLTLPSTETINNSITADIEWNERMGSITCWESGHCDLLILAIETEERILWAHTLLGNNEQLNVILESFCRFISH